MNRGIGALLPAIPLWFALSAALAQVAGQVPAEVTAIKTERGITITSKASGDEFSLTVAGSDIRPLSQDRLKLKIDGRDVEIVTLPLGPDLVSKPDAEVLATYRIWVEHRLHDDGWQTIDASGADLSLPSGRSALLWRMQKQPPDPAQPSGLTIAASLNRHNVVALVGSYPDDNGQSALESYLRAALATLRAEEPAPPPKQEQTLAAGAGLRQILGLWSTLTGEEARALLNKRLMTEADNDLILATPAEPEVLMLGLRQAVQDAGAKAAFSTVVFDGKAAHVIVVVAYDGRAKAFTYMDPWRRGSFLAAGNNAAGLAATPHPTQPRHWIVKADQLKSVAYAVELPGLAIEHVAAVIPLGAFGPMGQTISDAQRTDLFTWFHLEQTAIQERRRPFGHHLPTERAAVPAARIARCHCRRQRPHSSRRSQAPAQLH